MNGPTWPRITIDGAGQVQVIVVGSGSTLNLENLTLIGGATDGEGGGIKNDGTLNVANSTFSQNVASDGVAID